MKRFFFDCGTRDATASLGLFVLRVGAGLMMLLGHGIPKIQRYAELKATWTTADIWPLSHLSSEINLIFTIGAEVGAAGLLVLGLMTRPAAFVLGFAMVVAAFQVGGTLPWFATPPALSKESALVYLLPAIVLVLTSGGAWSLDGMIHRDGSKRRRW